MALWITLIIILLSIIAFVIATIFSSRFRNDLLAGSGKTTVFGFLSVSGATIVLILAILIGSAVYVSQQLGDKPFFLVPEKGLMESEKVISRYFSNLNEGLAGENEAFLRCWNKLSLKEQDRKKQKYSSLKLPEDYGLLYRNSGNHYLKSITQIDGNEESGEVVYFVVYAIRESHPTNPLYKSFCPSTRDRLEDFCDVLELERIKSSILDCLKSSYDVERAAQARNMTVDDLLNQIFEESIKKNFLNRIISPRLLTELAAAYDLALKKAPAGVTIVRGNQYYDIYQGDRIHVAKTSEGWKINIWNTASFYAYTSDI